MEKPIRIVHYNTGMDNGPCNGKPLYTDVWWLPKKVAYLTIWKLCYYDLASWKIL